VVQTCTTPVQAVRQAFAWLDNDGTVVVRDTNGTAEWWTFAGTGANATLAYALSQETQSLVQHDSFTVTFEPHVSVKTIAQVLNALRVRDVHEMRPAVDEEAIAGLKFAECLPHDLALDILQRRLCDPLATQRAIGQPVQFVTL
jgi:ATP-dependent Lhr-like helicase